MLLCANGHLPRTTMRPPKSSTPRGSPRSAAFPASSEESSQNHSLRLASRCQTRDSTWRNDGRVACGQLKAWTTGKHVYTSTTRSECRSRREKSNQRVGVELVVVQPIDLRRCNVFADVDRGVAGGTCFPKPRASARCCQEQPAGLIS